MAQSKFRRFDVQASYALVLSLVSVLPCAAAAGVLLMKYDGTLGQIVYGAGGMVAPVFLLCVAVSLLSAFAGFLFGLSSAGQRRNDKSKQSWVGFFVGGTVCTLNVIMVIAFMMLRLVVPT